MCLNDRLTQVPKPQRWIVGTAVSGNILEVVDVTSIIYAK